MNTGICNTSEIFIFMVKIYSIIFLKMKFVPTQETKGVWAFDGLFNSSDCLSNTEQEEHWVRGQKVETFSHSGILSLHEKSSQPHYLSRHTQKRTWGISSFGPWEGSPCLSLVQEAAAVWIVLRTEERRSFQAWCDLWKNQRDLLMITYTLKPIRIFRYIMLLSM